jgi:hypothetical protein
MTPTLRTICYILLGGLLAWWLVASRPERVKLLSGVEMASLIPNFQMSLEPLDKSKLVPRVINKALQDAALNGEQCVFSGAVLCPRSQHIAIILTVQEVSDTELIYLADGECQKLLGKAYWNGFSGWGRD